jgi:hypothetical protein
MATNANTTSAKAIIRQSLDQWNLGALADWVWQQYLGSGASNPGEAMMLIMPDLRERPEYKARFPAMADLAARGPAISESEYVGYEKTVAQVMRAAGLPPSFYDSPDDYARLLRANVSPDEVQSRVMNGYARVAHAPAEVRAAFHEFFGAAGDNALAAYFIDPAVALPVLEQQMTAATVAGIGRRFDIGTDRDLSMQLAQQGVDAGRAEQTFAELSASEGLFEENFGEVDELDIGEEGVLAAFNQDPEARRRVERRSQSRQAAFSGSGGAAATRAGAVGLGEAGRP